MTAPTPKAPRAEAAIEPRVSRQDGRATRLRLLNTAGELYAERGRWGATAKEIAQRAGTPAASIHYHFGSLEGLHRAVFSHARAQLDRWEERVQQQLQSVCEPAPRLSILLECVFEWEAAAASAWPLQMALRASLRLDGEPSTPFASEAEFLPRFGKVLASCLQLPDGHAAAARAVRLVAMAVGVWLMAEDRSPDTAARTARQAEALGNELTRFVIGGLAHLKSAETKEIPSQPRGRPRSSG